MSSEPKSDPHYSDAPPKSKGFSRLWACWLGAVVFYTCLPIPARWRPEFLGIARFAPLVGLLLGSLLALIDASLDQLGMPILVRSSGIIALELALTGGLHLDGAIDAADGLAVGDRHRRLAVMADSRTGAFGAMAAVVILGLKSLALADVEAHRALTLMLMAGWGRWGQVWAIACYRYLRPKGGKGAFHQQDLRPIADTLLGAVVLGTIAVSYWGLIGADLGLLLCLGGLGIAIGVAAWFNHQLGGHTGDTYGATVEWTETLLLCLATLLV